MATKIIFVDPIKTTFDTGESNRAIEYNEKDTAMITPTTKECLASLLLITKVLLSMKGIIIEIEIKAMSILKKVMETPCILFPMNFTRVPMRPTKIAEKTMASLYFIWMF